MCVVHVRRKRPLAANITIRREGGHSQSVSFARIPTTNTMRGEPNYVEFDQECSKND